MIVTLPRFQSVGAGASAYVALAAAIADCRSHALDPVTVVVPSNEAGLAARRALGRDGGLVNVRFMVFDRLAELLASAHLQSGMRPLVPAIRIEAARSVLREQPGRFEPVADNRLTAEALAETFRELSTLSEAERESLAERSESARETIALFDAFAERTAAFYDASDLYALATAALGANGLPADIGHVILFQPTHPQPGAAMLARALYDAGALHVLAYDTGSAEPSPALDAFARELGAAPAPTATGAPSSISLIVAEDPDEEVRTVIRELAAEIDNRGIPLHRIAILYSAPALYAPICEELLAAAGIPANGRSVRTLRDTLPGRTLSALLRIATEQYSRHAVIEFFSLPLSPSGEPPFPGARWDVIARDAGVVGGSPAHWRQRLAHFNDGLEQRRAEAVRDSLDARVARIDADIARVGRLLAALETLHQRLIALDRAQSWSGAVDRLRSVLDDYLPPRSAFDEEQAANYDALLQELAGLEALDEPALRSVPSATTVQEQLERVLDRPLRRGRFEEGVYTGPIARARGLAFDRVYLLGMIEGLMPTRPRLDPLLPAELREGVPGLESASRRASDEQREAFLHACAAAPDVRLCYPVGDLRGQSRNLPSRWLLREAARLAGQPGSISSETFHHWIETAEDRPSWLHLTPSFAAAIASSGVPATATELRLHEIAAHPGEPTSHPYLAAPPLSRGLVAQIERRSTRFTPWDGLLAGEAYDWELPPLSPTALEEWAQCGRRFFLGRILRVPPTNDPEVEFEMSPLDRGQLIHSTLERFFSEFRAIEPGEKWEPHHSQRLKELFDEQAAIFQRAGLTGLPLKWKIERETLLRQLERLLKVDEEIRERLGLRIEALEYAFGDGDGVRIAVGGAELRVRGRIDRLDRDAEGRYHVYDFKTGNPDFLKIDAVEPFKHEIRLQLPLYARAIEAATGGDVAESAYWALRPGVGKEADPFSRFPFDRGELVDDALEAIAAGMREGIFPANPGKNGRDGGQHCMFCDYKTLCPPGRAREWNRKSGASELASYTAIGASVNDDDDDEDNE